MPVRARSGRNRSSGWREIGRHGELPGVDRFSALISVESLASVLAEPALVLVDCRASLQDPAAGRAAYAEAHLPRAVFADLLQDLSGPIVPGKTGRHPLPAVGELVERLRGWGVGQHSQVVVYDDAGGAFAARLWWLLRWLGHDAVALLDGGFSAWVAAGKPTTRELPLNAVGDFEAKAQSGLLAGAAELLQSAPRKLFDARAPERFRGDVEPIDPVAGHIPGAENLPFAGNLREGRFLQPAELRARFDAALAGTPPEQAVVYCGSGVTACHDVLAFAHAGLPLPRLYAGSWSEWITDASRPVAKGR
jgi:thiosulfate/3-mercaptopyruvate sulfurtransferase